MKNIIVAVTLLASTVLSGLAQERKFVDHENIFTKLEELKEAEKFEDAITELDRIPKYDSTYNEIVLEKIVLHMNLENWEQAIELCDEGIARDGEYLYLFYQNKGGCLSRMGKPEEAYELNQKVLEIFPKQINVKYNAALNLIKTKKYKEAKEIFQEIILESPYMSSAHLELGKLALRDNETARMMMCFNVYFMCLSHPENANHVLSYLNHLATSKKDSVPVGMFKDSEEDFVRLNLVLDNYVALEKGYKTGTKVAFAAIKQNHLLFNQLAEMPKNKKGFWNEFYLPLFRSLIESGQFQNYTWYILQASENEKHQKLVKKNAGNISKFSDWRSEYFGGNWLQLTTDDKNQVTVQGYYSNEVLKNIGGYDNAKKEVEGPWKYYWRNGKQQATGQFKNNERTGDWKWYFESGELKSEATMSDGKINGQMVRHYKNGLTDWECNYVDDEREGMFLEYYLNGEPYQKTLYEKGKREGLSLKYYVHGVMSDSAVMADDLTEGEYQYYHTNGALKVTGTAKEGKRDGLILSYFNNGQLKAEYTYKDGDLIGHGKEYFKNGKLSYEGEFKEDSRIGIHTSYNLDGTKYFESNYDESGKENGGRTYYDYEGRPHEIYVYNKGFIAAYKFLDKDGNVVKEAKKRGNNFEYSSIYFDGTPNSNGLFNIKGGKEGKWEYHNADGVLASVRNHKKGELEGEQKYYHPNGELKTEFTVKDGNREAEYRTYFSNGQLEQNGLYLEGLMEGEWFTYHANGQLSEIEYYVNDVRTYNKSFGVDGKVEIEVFYEGSILDKIVYYDYEGELAGSFNFENGNGKLGYKFPNGKLQADGDYILGNRHGEFTYYEFDGRVSSKGNYYMGKYNGVWNYYHENGQLSETTEYFYGERTGKYTGWDWVGNKTTDGQYENGKAVGVWTYYYPNGVKESTSEFLYGDYHGKRENFSPNGKLQMVRYYDHDVLNSYSYSGKDGKLVEPIKVDRMKDKLVAYYANGKVSREFNLDRGMIQGDIIEYNMYGAVTYKGNYVDDEREGTRFEYYSNGNKQTEKTYENGYAQGVNVLYWENGNKQLEIPYVLGEKHGTGFAYDKNGKKLMEFKFNNNQLIGETKL